MRHGHLNPAASLRNNPAAMQILKGGIMEQSFYLDDKKVRADTINPRLKLMADLFIFLF